MRMLKTGMDEMVMGMKSSDTHTRDVLLWNGVTGWNLDMNER
jgi:hypothetical protein